MHVSPMTWVARALWFLLPLTLGGWISDAVDGTASGTVAVLAWAIWAIGLFASVVVLPDALVAWRTVAPVPLLGGVVVASVEHPDAVGWVGLAMAAFAVVATMSAEVGADFVNGSSYGDERRLPLRPPSALLVGPIPAVWALVVLPVPVAALLAAHGQWAAAVPVAAAGVGLVVVGFQILRRLARRWLVLVPAGLTIVDPMALAEPILLRRTAIVRLGPAPADTDALDLSVGAAGLILQADLSEPVELVRAVRRGGVGEPQETSSLLVAPSRPGRLLAIAEDRRIAVGRS